LKKLCVFCLLLMAGWVLLLLFAFEGVLPMDGPSTTAWL